MAPGHQPADAASRCPVLASCSFSAIVSPRHSASTSEEARRIRVSHAGLAFRTARRTTSSRRPIRSRAFRARDAERHPRSPTRWYVGAGFSRPGFDGSPPAGRLNRPPRSKRGPADAGPHERGCGANYGCGAVPADDATPNALPSASTD